MDFARAKASVDRGGEGSRGLPAGVLAWFAVRGKASPWPSLPVLTLRKMAGLRVTGLHFRGLLLLQVPTVAERPEGTDDLSPPSPRAAALGALGPRVGVGR